MRATIVVSVSVFAFSVFAQATTITCGPEFTRLSGIVGEEEAGRAVGMRKVAESDVAEEFRKLRAEARYHGVSDHNVQTIAQNNVRARLPESDRARFDQAAKEIGGRADMKRVLEIFNDPTKHLGDKGLETTTLEDRLLSALAFKFVTKRGLDTPEASHLADHVAAVRDPKVAAVLKAMGIRSDAVIRNVLTHDLGKEYAQLPENFRAFLESLYPLPKKGEKDPYYLPRNIMSHEFGSMIVAEQLAREAGIPETKIPRILALFAHHNAGYDPKLPGFHFWVQPFAWKAFADAMNTQGLDVPTTYEAIPTITRGGSPETVVLTAIDRATSLTLASQEKFTPVLVTGGKFNNEGLVGQFSANASNVVAEVKDVLGKLDGADAMEARKSRALGTTLLKFYEPDVTRLTLLSREMPQMASGEGAYADRPAMSQDDLKSSVVYKKKDGTWCRVTSDGFLYETKTGAWGQPKYGEKRDPSQLLFREVINPEFSYVPRSLPADLVK